MRLVPPVVGINFGFKYGMGRPGHKDMIGCLVPFHSQWTADLHYGDLPVAQTETNRGNNGSTAARAAADRFARTAFPFADL